MTGEYEQVGSHLGLLIRAADFKHNAEPRQHVLQGRI
jgi:hypothetical protein